MFRSKPFTSNAFNSFGTVRSSTEDAYRLTFAGINPLSTRKKKSHELK